MDRDEREKETDNVRVIETKELDVSGGNIPELRVVKQLDQTGNEVDVVLDERKRTFFFFFVRIVA